MKRVIIISILIVLFWFVTVKAQDSGFGIGIILGDPTGLSFKLWTTYTTAVDAAVAWSFRDHDARDHDARIHLHADYIIHNFELIKLDFNKLPIYYGIGGRIKFVEWDDHHSRIGVRIPLGLNFIPARVPLDFFVEIVPLLDLAPEVEFDFNGGIGFRYFFK
ncbi:MAG: hypothetical protein OEZ20_04170 [candidate division WOR-3 bacterium]|nr:hypothetical protein [candidate division WOR-3 bacterium]MDH5683642.1 hypothetical protein [candidate division WOR-3 bacterium]